ncbi:CBO0543 family protein [Paenibacillus gansuensis]|uniref:CBO0543 family protein n=1 Tax=Paenibacillus gansuensis TaxID=306542 RepID=A0ABW5PH90_9BACL
MHVLFTLAILCFVYFKGDWRDWQKYGLSMFYPAACDLLYNILCQDKLLWSYHPDPHLFPRSHVAVDLLYTFLILPSVALMYLTNYPFGERAWRQCKYILLWVAGSLAVEYVFIAFGRLELMNGYRFWMEALFYPTMYLMLRLHYTRPVLTYLISIFIIWFLMSVFEVPLPH